MERILELIFRQPIRLLLLVVVLPLVGLAIVYILPPSYQSTASLWALQVYDPTNTSGTYGNPTTPASNQVITLTELLQSRTFALAVAKSTKVASTLNLNSSVLANSQLLDDALFNEISHHVQVAALGDNLYTVTYTNTNPEVAKQVVDAVVSNYNLQLRSSSLSDEDQLLLTLAKQDVNAATDAEGQYLLNHPNLIESGVSPLKDPQYAALDLEKLKAQSILQMIEARITANKQQYGSQQNANNLFTVLDPPQVPIQPVSRVKSLLIGGSIGLGLAILACTVYILVSVRRDRTVHTVSDLQALTVYPILMQLPKLTSPTKELLLQDHIHS